MANPYKSTVRRQLATLFNLGAIRELTDGQLLERFATETGESRELAFAALVERHGPLVLRVCQSVLVDPDDTKDAFQATFLVLLKKTRALWVRDSLGPWLHQVAYRTALHARSASARRRRHERSAALGRPEKCTMPEDGLEQVLHDEINRLPRQLRLPLVLCELEFQSHAQAARALNWPIGTVKSRISRGKARLRQRLGRRGYGPAAGVIAATPRPVGLSQTLPETLLDSTMRLVVNATTAGIQRVGWVGILTQGVLKSMFVARCLKIVLAIVVLGAASTVAILGNKRTSVLASQSQPTVTQEARADGSLHEVKPGKLRGTIVERGSLESARNLDIVNEIEGMTTILKILPEGTRVKKGDLVAELDSSVLRDKLTNQEIQVQRAAADWENAVKTGEVAEIELKEYKEGTYSQESAILRHEMSIAKSAIEKTRSRLERTKRARERLGVLAAKQDDATPADILAVLDLDDRIEAAELLLDREQLSLEVAGTKRELFERYAAPKRFREMQILVDQAKSSALAKRATYNLEASKLEKLKGQLGKCILCAPTDGLIVYANDRLGSGKPMIEEGAMVRERQKIFSLPDLSRMRVNAKVHERYVDWLKPGGKVRVRVDALAERTFTGQIQSIAPLPDPVGVGPSNSKVYSTIVEIETGDSMMRPGMTAEAEFLIAELENVLSVPVEAVVIREGKSFVAVQSPTGPPEWRLVNTGISDGRVIEIKRGLKTGERVHKNPPPLSSEGAKRARAGGFSETAAEQRP